MNDPTAVTDFVMKTCLTKACYRHRAALQLHEALKNFGAHGGLPGIVLILAIALIVFAVIIAVRRTRRAGAS